MSYLCFIILNTFLRVYSKSLLNHVWILIIIVITHVSFNYIQYLGWNSSWFLHLESASTHSLTLGENTCELIIIIYIYYYYYIVDNIYNYWFFCMFFMGTIGKGSIASPILSPAYICTWTLSSDFVTHIDGPLILPHRMTILSLPHVIIIFEI